MIQILFLRVVTLRRRVFAYHCVGINDFALHRLPSDSLVTAASLQTVLRYDVLTWRLNTSTDYLIFVNADARRMEDIAPSLEPCLCAASLTSTATLNAAYGKSFAVTMQDGLSG